jgi:glycosyltransferase involved in cell wall biosynthesis
MLRRVTKILCIGTRNAEFYLQYRKKEQLNEALLAFPLPHLNKPFETAKPSRSDDFGFLVLGRLDAIKAVDRVISAYALLDRHSQARSRLFIAGDGPCRAALEAQVDALGLCHRVEFLGPVPSDQAPDVFGRANALVLASLDEPWGLVVNEAMSSAIPVIGPFWIGAFTDLVVHGKTGIVTLDNSPAQLSAAMQTLLSDPERAAAMGQAGRNHVREQGWNIEGSLQAFGQLPVFDEVSR